MLVEGREGDGLVEGREGWDSGREGVGLVGGKFTVEEGSGREAQRKGGMVGSSIMERMY